MVLELVVEVLRIGGCYPITNFSLKVSQALVSLFTSSSFNGSLLY